VRIDTNIVHGGQHADELTGAHVPPIYQTSTFVFKNADHGACLFKGTGEGYIYTRLGNPTIDLLAKKMALLESGEAGFVFASGLAAILATVLTTARSGEHILSDATIYGGSVKQFNNILPRCGIQVTYADATDHKKFEGSIRPETRMILIETPANPTLKIIDIKRCGEIAHRHNALLCVDNTFATPYLQRPIELGADIVVHSMTKYLGGHGDIVGGVTIGKKNFIDAMAKVIAREMGASISPFNAWLVLRGLKTLAVRMDKHTANASAVADFLQHHPRVEKVYYPGLASHAGHEIAAKQMSGYGGMVGFDIKGGKPAGRTLMDSVKLCALAVSLGDVDTLIEHPASMTHSSLTERDLVNAGFSAGFVRLSVGIENARDIIDDLEQALNKV
jgi:methionine-gamma-lyase